LPIFTEIEQLASIKHTDVTILAIDKALDGYENCNSQDGPAQVIQNLLYLCRQEKTGDSNRSGGAKRF